MKKEISKEIEQLLTKRASLLLNCFGYENMKPEYLALKDYNITNGIYDYILVEFENKYFQLTYDTYMETRTWKLIDVTESI